MEIIGTIREVRTVKQTNKGTGESWDKDLITVEVSEPLSLLTVEVPQSQRAAVAQVAQMVGKRVLMPVRAKGFKGVVYWGLSGAVQAIADKPKAVA